MQDAHKPRFAKSLDSLAALFSRELDKPALRLYWSAVSDLSIEQFEAAVTAAACSCQHFPPPAELRALVAADDNPKLRAEEAWPEVMRLARRSSGDHSDPVAKEAIRLMGGGQALGQRNQDELEKWGRKEFVDHYQEIHNREKRLALEAAQGQKRIGA